MISALLDRGADPCLLCMYLATSVMWQAYMGNLGCVARLLQDPRVRATVNLQDKYGDTALHRACTPEEEDKGETSAMVHHLLQAGANPFLTNRRGLMPLVLLQQQWPENDAAMALLEQTPEAQKTSLLVQARRIFAVSTSNAMVPSYLQGRVARGQALARVNLTPITGANKSTKERRRKLRTMLAFMCGIRGGPKGEGMPRDVFRVVLNMLMPTWDPLRRGNVGEGGEVLSD